MEQALYHPEHGYYSSGRCVIGRAGDYFTNVSVGSLFGRLLAAQFTEMWTLLGRPAEFIIVEQGAQDGRFACDVLESVRQRSPEFFAALVYRIVEPFPVLEARQRETLAGFTGQVSWHKSVAELAPFSGVHFSNELLDALPVHLVRWSDGGWLERHVTSSDEVFEFVDLPIADSALRNHLALIATPLPDGCETEVNLEALHWVDEVAAKLARGFLLAADYGFARDAFYGPERRAGTLQCYARHRVVRSPLTQIGHADITAHVDWMSIAERGEASGLTLSGFADQHHFITGLLAADNDAEVTTAADAKTKRGLQTLLHPTLLGTAFQFLAFSKNIAPTTRLAGFRFGRDPRLLLEPAGARLSS